MAQLYLASGSPRRRELLQQIGVSFQRLSVEVPEIRDADEVPAEYVQRLALDKARAGIRALQGEPGVVLGADTIGVLDRVVLEKPRNREHGAELLRAMSGREHTVMTAVALTDGKRETLRLVQSQVQFRPLSEVEISRYWDTGEPADKAGGYAIQGLGAVFVRELHGSYSAVVGLPLEATAQMLGEYNIPIWQN